jgi:tetratricopeptide (TPR) repeat protein
MINRRTNPRDSMTTRSFALLLIALLVLGPTGCARFTSQKSKNTPAPIIDDARVVHVTEDAETAQRIEAFSRFATGVHYDLSDNPAAANDQYLQAALSDLTNEELILDVSGRLIREGKTDRAIDLLARATSSPDSPGRLHALLGLAYLQTGRTNEAVTANREAIKRAPDNLAAYQNLAGLHLQAGRTNEAKSVLLQAAARTNASPEFLIGTVDILARYHRQNLFTAEQNREQTLALLDAAAAQKPENPIVLQRIGDLYMLHSEPTKAEPLYLALLERFPGIPGLRERLANIYIRLDRNAEAEKLLQEISRDNPTDPATYFFLGSIAYEAKDYDKAAEHYETALRLNPEFEPLYYDLAGVHIARQQPAEALALLQKARAKFKLTFVLEFYSGIAEGMMENWSEALSRLTSAEVLARTTEPNRLNHLFYYQLGSVHERSGNIPQAVENLKKALELSPDYADALNYLGYMWAERGENLDEARSMIEKAVEAEPENAAFLDSLAWVLFKLKRTEEALTWMQKAIAHSEEPDATLFDHLGDIYLELQKIDLAREAYTKSLAVKPDDKIKEKLEKLTTR